MKWHDASDVIQRKIRAQTRRFCDQSKSQGQDDHGHNRVDDGPQKAQRRPAVMRPDLSQDQGANHAECPEPAFLWLLCGLDARKIGIVGGCLLHFFGIPDPEQGEVIGGFHSALVAPWRFELLSYQQVMSGANLCTHLEEPT